MDRVQIRTGRSAGEQESSFMNATLQNVGGDDGIAFSIATFVEVPAELVNTGLDPEGRGVAEYLRGLFWLLDRHAAAEGFSVRFEIEVGREDDADD
jgi:hypothetical protein